LSLPSVATWWCGQNKELQYVREHLEDLVIKPAFSPASSEPVFGSTLGEKDRHAFLHRISKTPEQFVGQEKVRLSRATVWENGGLQSRPMVLRAFICYTPNGYAVLPGALTRFSTSSDRLVVSMQSGG